MTQAKQILVLAVLLGAFGYVTKKTFFATPEPTTAPAAAATCANGTEACPNNCLKRETEGWRSMDVKGHPPTDVWMTFTDDKGSWVAFNQNHVGHVIQRVNGTPTDVGVCPVCKGSTRVCK